MTQKKNNKRQTRSKPKEDLNKDGEYLVGLIKEFDKFLDDNQHLRVRKVIEAYKKFFKGQI
jgi:hypothetical protein|tara:strand:+ start:521 stop:703 length:183 start_codon:yes stop_codon:yes gene_type:complete